MFVDEVLLSLLLPLTVILRVLWVRSGGRLPGGEYEGSVVTITRLTFQTQLFPHVLFLDIVRKSSLHPRTRGRSLAGTLPTLHIFDSQSAPLGAGTERATRSRLC